jgi:2-keto-4-pentenoate hydratase/2-oxohepta-3-ene-1,7-dioic acid hydratase in catechol pathway
MSRIQFSRLHTATGPTFAARVSGEAWHALEAAPWDLMDPTVGPLASARPVAGRFAIPVMPSKLIGIGKNYRAHAAEMGGPVPKEPLLFLKAPSSLLAHADSMQLPTQSERVDYEGELAVIIGKQARAVEVDSALDYVLGYCAACDITARDLQSKDGHGLRALMASVLLGQSSLAISTCETVCWKPV